MFERAEIFAALSPSSFPEKRDANHISLILVANLPLRGQFLCSYVWNFSLDVRKWEITFSMPASPNDVVEARSSGILEHLPESVANPARFSGFDRTKHPQNTRQIANFDKSSARSRAKPRKVSFVTVGYHARRTSIDHV